MSAGYWLAAGSAVVLIVLALTWPF